MALDTAKVTDILATITWKAVSAICKSIREIVRTIKSFKSRLAQLLNTVESVNSILNDEMIEQCRVFPFKHTVVRLKNAVKQAEQFADKCSKVAWWNCYKKYTYAKEIANLNDSLSNLQEKVESGFQLVTQERQFDAMNEKLDRIKAFLENKSDEVLILQNKSDAGVVSQIRGYFNSVIQKFRHQLTSYAERFFSRNDYQRLLLTN